jgi:phenylacetate-coenzyme A ligase PaaK-like adenylate-forming protein
MNSSLTRSPVPEVLSDDELRELHVEEQRWTHAEHVQRLHWSRERIAQERRHRLREVVSIAQEHSAWHRRRLAGVDPATLDESAIGRLPVMTEADVMDSFDEIVTDPRLSLAGVKAHLASVESETRYLLGHYQTVASVGSNGQCGAFVYDWHGWTTCRAGVFRYLARDLIRPAPVGAPPMINWWLTPEAGPIAVGCGHGSSMHVSDDLVILEAVDENRAPVAAGVRSAKVLVTVLYNHALPLIRYELADEVTLLEGRCRCGSAHTLVHRRG